MSFKCWDITRTSTSPRLIPEWKDLKPLLKGILKDKQVGEKTEGDVKMLSDWTEILCQESHHPESKPFICFYSTDDNYFVSLNWVELYSKQMQAVLWIQKKAAEMEGVIKKIKFHVMAQVPPIQAMVHIAPYHMLIAYCDDMCLRLFGDHHQGFISLGMVPCRFSISCLSYDSETEMLLSGTLGAVVTWFILPNGRGLQMAQTVPMPGGELVQGFSLNGPPGFLVAHCENKLRVFTHQGQGQLEEVKKFTPINSGSTITCSFTCLSQGYFYVGNKDGEIHAWGLDRGNFLHSFQAHSSSVICIQSRSETYTLLTAGGEGVVKEWNLAFGNLLRQLDIDKNMQRLQFIDNSTFFCQTNHNFSLYHLRYFYSLFNVCGSAPQEVRRVCCGHNWTRILCATKDGLLRFLSPVTGDLLVITWPLLIMDKAVAWAYDSHREELFVATDGSEVLVFDATRSPCTAKYLMCPSVNPGDRVRCLAYGHYHLGKGLVGLMFSGHDSGTVRILSHYSCARVAKILHSGAVLALSTLEGPQEYSLVCSYGMDNIVYLTEAVLQGNRVVLQPVSKIICVWPLKHVILLPGSVGAITENHHWHLWSYQNLLTSPGSKQRSDFKETECLHRCAITSFDVCLSLKLFVTGDTGGLVRIWDFHGKLISELDSALHFGPLCFANDRGDLLLTFNQSLYLVSCLKLLPPAQLIHLTLLNNADDIQEAPKPFLPSFFFSFEKVFVPKFVYFGQGLQELRGLEALVNKRMIAFDHTVPHVVEEERPKSSVMQEGPTLHFLEDKYTDFPILTPKRDRPPFVVPPQLRLGGWDGLKPYQILRCFFGQGRPWPFPPDGYIPNSVIRARLWPEGTPVFLHCDLHSSYQDKDWDMTGLSRSQALSPVTSIKQKISKRKPDRKPTLGKQTFFDILVNLASQNWMGRKLDEGLINTIIETILNLTVYCSIEQYKTYISILAQIFASHQVSPRWHSETACRLMEDTTHSNPEVRETAWEGLEKLGFMSRLFAIPLAVGLMDSDKNVRAKALYLMVRVTGIQTKSMLIALLKRRDTLQEMQEDFIGEISLDQLLGIQPSGIQYLLTQVEQRLNENLTLSHREEKPPLLLVISRDRELDEQTLKIWSEPAKIAKPDQRMTRVTAKSKNLNYSLPRSSVHGISQARILEWVAISFSRRSSHNKYQGLISLCCAVLTHFSPVQLFGTLWTVDCQAPLSTGFPKQEYWSELPFPSLGGLPTTNTKSYFFRDMEIGIKEQALLGHKAFVVCTFCYLLQQFIELGVSEDLTQDFCVFLNYFSPNISAVKKDMKISRKQGETELSPVLVTLEHEGEQREAKESDQIDIQDVASEPELSLSTLSPVTSKEDAESKEVVLETKKVTELTKALEIKKAVKAREAVESMGVMKAIDQQYMRDYGKVIPEAQRQEHLKKLWERAMKKTHHKVSVKLKEKRKLKEIPETTAEEPKKEVIQVAEQEDDATKVFRKDGRGLSGIPGRTTKSETRSWRDDICNLVTSRIASSNPGMLRDLSEELVNWAQAILAPQEPSWDLFQEICPLLKDSSELDDMEMEETPVVTEGVTEVVKEEKTVGLGEQEQRAKKMLKKGKVSSKVKKKKVAYLDDHQVSDKMRFQKVKILAMQKGKIIGEERKLSKQDLKLMQGKEKLTKDKKSILQKEKRAEEEEISPISQKKLTKAEQKLVQGEKKGTGKEEELLGKGKRVNWERGKVTRGQRTWYSEKVTLDHKEGRQAQEEGLPAWEERKLLHEEEELIEEEEELMEEEEELMEEEEELMEEEEELMEEEEELMEEEEELMEEEEELSEEDEELRKELEVLGEELEKLVEALGDLNEELEELGEEEEALTQKEEIIQNLEKQIEKMMKSYRKMKKQMGETEKHDKEEAWEWEKLAQEEEHLSKEEERLSGEEGKWTLKRHSLVKQEMKLIREKKKSFMIEKKEARKKKQIQEKEKQVEKPEKVDQERQAKEKEEDAKDKQLARKRQKLSQKEEEMFGEKEKLSQQEVKQIQKKASKAWEKEGGTQKVEKITKKKRRQISGKNLDLGEKGEAREMEKLSLKEEKQAQEGKRQDQKKEKLTPKVEEAAEEKTQLVREKMKLVSKEKSREKIEKVSPKEEKWVMEKEDKISKEKKQWAQERKLALPEEKQAQKERIWGQKESERIKQWAWRKEKLSQEEKKQAGEMDKKSQQRQARALEKRLTQEDSIMGKEERHIAKKERAIAREGIGVTKRKEKATQEEKETIEEEGKLAYDVRAKEMGVAKEEKKRIQEESIQGMRKLDMGMGISSEGRETSSREKDIRKKESHLMRILVKIIREMNKVPLKETGIPEEDQLFSMGMSETDGQRWEFSKEPEEITREEKQLVQRERKLEDDRLATEERILTDEEGLEEDQRLLEKVQENILLDKTQVDSMLKEAQQQNLLGEKQLKKLLKIIKEKKPEKTQVKWLLENIRDILFEGLSESLLEKEVEAPTKKRIDEERLIEGEEEEEEEILPKKEKRKHLMKKKEKKVSLSEEELEESLAGKHKKKSSTQIRKKEKKLTQEKEKLHKKVKEGPHEEEMELFSKEEGRDPHMEEEEEDLSEEEESQSEENLSEEEEGLSEEESLSEEEEEGLSEEEEGLSEEEKSLSEKEKSLSKKEKALREKKSLSEKEEKEEKMEKAEKKEEEKKARQKDEESMSKEKEQPRKLTEAMLPIKQRVWKTELPKEGVNLSKPATVSEVLAEKREDTAKEEMAPKRDRLLYGQVSPTVRDKTMWPTIMKSPLETPFPVALGKEKGMVLKVLGHHFDLEGQESQLLKAYPVTTSWGRQEDVLLEKGRGMFLQVMGMETQTPKGLHKPKSHLLEIIRESQKPKRRPKDGTLKWFLKSQDSQKGKTEGQAPAPAPTTALYPSLTSMPAKRLDSPDEDWISNVLVRLEAGEQLSRDSFHRLSQLLKHLTSKGYLKQTHLYSLKAVAKRLQQNLQGGHRDISRCYKDALSPVYIKAIPPIRRKEMESWGEPFPIHEPVLLSATNRTQTTQDLSWHPLAESYRKEQEQQLSTAVKKVKHLYQTRKDVPTAFYPSMDKESLDIRALGRRSELPTFHKAKSRPIPTSALPSMTYRVQDPKALTWLLLGEPYRSARAQQLSHVLQEMGMQHFHPATRDIFTGAHASVGKQTLALMFQNDLRALKGEGKALKLPQLEKKAQPVSKDKEELPQWETFVALYHVLRMLQKRYARDSAAWMEQFKRLMDLYQLKSPRIQRLLLELLWGKRLQPQQIIYEDIARIKELVPGERLLSDLLCGSSRTPAGPLEFQNVVPLPGQNRVHTIQPTGIAQYGFLELAWKRLPRVNPYRRERLPNIPTPTL